MRTAGFTLRHDYGKASSKRLRACAIQRVPGVLIAESARDGSAAVL